MNHQLNSMRKTRDVARANKVHRVHIIYDLSWFQILAALSDSAVVGTGRCHEEGKRKKFGRGSALFLRIPSFSFFVFIIILLLLARVN